MQRPSLRRAGSLAYALAVVALCAASASSACAQDDAQDEARAHHETAVSLFEQGRYAEAVLEFRRAHELSGRNHVLLNVARSLELAGEFGSAADALDDYLAAEPEAEDAESLRRRSAELRRRAPAATPPPEPEAP